MPWPETRAEFRELIADMRELGVVQAHGITVGPPPPKLELLARAVEEKPEDVALKQELAEAQRLARLEAARQEKRDMLAATGRVYSDAEIDRFLDPRVLE